MPNKVRLLGAAIIAASLLAVCSGAPEARADFDARRWEFRKEIVPVKDARGNYARVTLDSQVYHKSKRDLADLRVVDGSGREVPYVLGTGGAVAPDKREYTARIFNNSVVKGKYNSFDLDLGKPGNLNSSLDIQTPSVNFLRRVEIQGSDKGVEWATLRDDGHIFDFSHDKPARRTSVTYPENTYRYLRVKIWNYKEKPVQVEGAVIHWSGPGFKQEALRYEGKGTQSQNAEEKSTDIIVDRGRPGVPTRRVVIVSPDVNYRRQVEIDSSDDGKGWRNLGQDSIFRYDTPTFRGKETAVCYGEDTSRYIRIRILDYDNPPITVSRVKLYGVERRLFFPRKSGGRYSVYYGNPYANAPAYDIRETLKYVPAAAYVAQSLGNEKKNTLFREFFTPKTWLNDNPWALWAALIAAVALMGILIIRLILQTPRPQPPG